MRPFSNFIRIRKLRSTSECSAVGVYYFNGNIIGRSSGRSAVGAAAYRSGERLHTRAVGSAAYNSGKGLRDEEIEIV
jgi:hypothetical protein